MSERETVTVALTKDERREVAQLAYEFAARLGREKDARARKRGERFREIAAEIHDFGLRQAGSA